MACAIKRNPAWLLLLAALASGSQDAQEGCWTPQEGVATYEDENETVFDTCNVSLTSCPPAGEVTICPNVTVVPRCSFAGCTGITRLNIPASVAEIEVAAFEMNVDCNSTDNASCGVQEIDFVGGGLARIGEAAFKFNKELAQVALPDSVVEIGPEAFEYCEALAAATVGGAVETIGSEAFKETALTEFAMPDSVRAIGRGAFQECRRLASLSLSDQLAVIPSRLCRDCESLLGMHIPDSVTEIGPEAFEYCLALASMTLPGNLTVIPFEFCQDCSLTSIRIPDSVTSIGDEAFERCRNLATVDFGSGVVSIGHQAFRDAESLTIVSLPDSVETIGNEAFAARDAECDDTENGATDRYSDGCDDYVESPSDCGGADDFDFTATDMCCACAGGRVESTIVTVTLGAGLVEIGEQAFKNVRLTQIVFPEGLEVIRRRAFENTLLTNVTVPASVLVVEGGAFWVGHRLHYCEKGNATSYEECGDEAQECPGWEAVMTGEQATEDVCDGLGEATDNASNASNVSAVSNPNGPCCACGGGETRPAALPYNEHMTRVCGEPCRGRVFMNETYLVGGECLRTERHIVVDTSHCGFEVTPDYHIFDEDLTVYNCSHVSNPTPTGFEMFCTFSPTFSTTATTETTSTTTETDTTGTTVTTTSQTDTTGTTSETATTTTMFTLAPPARRLNTVPFDVGDTYSDYDFEVYYDDEHKVVTWTATLPAFLEECRDKVDNLTDRISDLESEINDLLDTETTTLSSTSISMTTTETTETETTMTETNTTQTMTTITIAPAVLTAGVSIEDCDTLLAYIIASLAFNGLLLLLLLLGYGMLRRRKSVLSEQTNLIPQQGVHYDAEVQSRPGTSAAPSELAQSAAPSQSNALSLGGSAQVQEVQNAGQQTADSWAGRSMIYRYLRHSRRTGNDVEAASRRGWKMNVVEPPNMEDPQSAANSQATSAVSRSTRGVSFAAERAGVEASPRSANSPAVSGASRSARAVSFEPDGPTSGGAAASSSGPTAEAEIV